jgi:hypothetical protein
METLVGNNFSKRTILVMQLAGQQPHIVRPGKSEHPPSTRTEALRPPERLRYWTGLFCPICA